jgi:hypothetical protein
MADFSPLRAGHCMRETDRTVAQAQAGEALRSAGTRDE